MAWPPCRPHWYARSRSRTTPVRVHDAALAAGPPASAPCGSSGFVEREGFDCTKNAQDRAGTNGSSCLSVPSVSPSYQQRVTYFFSTISKMAASLVTK
jgi:hypothetical protein